MNITIFSMTPLFPNKSMGGAQVQLKKIAIYLGEIGHNVTILCTRRDDSMEVFHWSERVKIVPLFRFKQPYPEPYATHVYNIASAIQDMGEHLANTDRYYSHDGGLIFPFIYNNVQSTISLRSIIFSETLQSAFLFQGDKLILPSEYSRRCYIETVGRFFPDLASRSVTIYNGLDWSKFRSTSPNRIKEIIPENIFHHDLLLFPHRPEEDKGIQQSLDLAEKLVHSYGLKNIKVLIPKWLDINLSKEVNQFYENLQARIREKGLENYFFFHDWIPDDLIPEYFSLGSLTLVLGNYVETFGNVAYESLGCSTPALVARVGPAREILPEDMIYKVDFNDTETAANLAVKIISKKEKVSSTTMDYLHENLSLEKMVSAYAEVILRDEKLSIPNYIFKPINQKTKFVLPTWCYISRNGIYHDFRAEYFVDNKLIELVEAKKVGFTYHEANKFGLNESRIIDFYRAGYLVPRVEYV